MIWLIKTMLKHPGIIVCAFSGHMVYDGKCDWCGLGERGSVWL